MQVNVVLVDVAPHLVSKEQPVIVVPRENKLWISVNFNADDEETFLYTAAGELARIPINAFRVPALGPQHLVAASMERVLRFIGLLKDESPRLEIEEILLFVGSQVHTINDSMRFYAGFAVTSTSAL
jgi:hypothetical protein